MHGGYVERSIQMIVTPRVRAEVQAHFNCPELEGAELEDQGEDGTALTHWEKRVFEVNRYKYRTIMTITIILDRFIEFDERYSTRN